MATSRFIDRAIGAATLNVSIYEEVEHDTSATGQAAAMVALVAVANAIGSVATFLITWEMGDLPPLPWYVIASLVVAHFSVNCIVFFSYWVLWSLLTLFVGRKLFGGTADLGEMLRTLGFAHAPGLLTAVVFIPVLGWIVAPVGWIWMLVCGIVAIRQALDFGTGEAIGTVLIAWLVGGLVLAVIALSIIFSAYWVFTSSWVIG